MSRFGSYVMCMTVYRSSLIWAIYLMRFPLKIALGVVGRNPGFTPRPPVQFYA